ncbi:MAG: lipocalin family protein [Bacteroidota bacterium]|nr:lipocalin family protein [Bacteroidota bacterium]
MLKKELKDILHYLCMQINISIIVYSLEINKSMKMNLKKYFTILLLLSFLTGFKSSNPGKIIIGKWKLDMEVTKKSFEDMYVASKSPEKDAFSKGMINTLLEIMGNTVSEYKENGELINTVTKVKPDGTTASKIYNGTWKLKKDNKTLIVVENERQRELEILSISDDKMQLKLLDKESAPMVLTFVRAE